MAATTQGRNARKAKEEWARGNTFEGRGAAECGRWSLDALTPSKCGTCHSKPPAGLYQLASGCWYANGVVTRTVPFHSDESDLWPELSPPCTPRKTEPQMADFYGEPNSFNYPRKPANLINMQVASFWSPYIRHGIYFSAKKPMKTKDDKEIYDIVEAQESQAAAWFREFCEPGPDGSSSRSVAKPKLPMPMRLGELDEPAFLKRHQTPTAESIFMDKLNATRAERRRQQKAAAAAANVTRHAEAKAAEKKRARERERRRTAAELIDVEVEGGRYTRRQLHMAGSSRVPRVLGALFAKNSARVQNPDTFGFPTATAELQTAGPGEKRACAVSKQRDPERIAGSRRVPHHLRVMLHDQGLPASHSQAAAAFTKGDRPHTSATGYAAQIRSRPPSKPYPTMSAHLAAYEEAQWQAKKREEQNSTLSGAQLVDEHSRLQSPTTVGGMRRVVDLNKPNLFNNYGKTTFKDYELHIPHALSSDVRALRGAHTRGRSSLTTTAPTFAPSAQLHPVPHHVLPRPSAPEVDPSPSKPGLELFPSRPGTSGGGGLSDDDSHSLASFGPPSTVVSRPNTRGTQGSLADSRPVTQGSLETPQFGERPATSDAPVVPRRTETTSSRPSSEGSQRKVAFADEAAKDSEHRRAPSGEGRRSALGRSSG